MDPIEPDHPLGEVLSRAVDSFGELVELHVALAKAEVARDAKAFVAHLAPLALGLPLILVGYLLTCVGIAIAIAPMITIAGGFAAVGGLNVVVGGIAAWASVRALKNSPLLAVTIGSELAESAQEVVPKKSDAPFAVEVPLAV